MFQNLDQFVDASRRLGRVTIAVAGMPEADVIEAVKTAGDLGLVDAILVGDENPLRELAHEVGLPAETRIIHEPDINQAALTAVGLVHDGEAQVLMKGLVNSAVILRAALNPERGLRCGKILSHLAALQIPGVKKLTFLTDAGVNIAPGLAEKKEIITNAVEALHKIGIQRPNVALLSANEVVRPKMPSTVDAHALADMWRAGEFPECVIEGPITMDVAASRKAAQQKRIESQISGNVDIFVVPDIDSGNMVAKTFLFYARAIMAGVILGTTHPIVMVSRADNAKAKVHSIAFASLLASSMGVKELGQMGS